MPSALSDTGRSTLAWLEEWRWDWREECEPWALPGGESVGGRVSFPLGLSLWRRPKNLDVDDCRPLLSMACAGAGAVKGPCLCCHELVSPAPNVALVVFSALWLLDSPLQILLRSSAEE
jgi:hypothetical protein